MLRCTALGLAAAALLLGATACGSTRPAPVPDVTGERLDVAEDTLDAAGLRYHPVGGGAFGIILPSRWTVCSQIPTPGKRATEVTLVVERSCPAPQPLVVPDVTGEQLDDARDELERSGFQVSAESLEDDPVLVESFWTVCEQRPEPGRRGREVELYVAHDCWDS